MEDGGHGAAIRARRKVREEKERKRPGTEAGQRGRGTEAGQRGRGCLLDTARSRSQTLIGVFVWRGLRVILSSA